MSLPMVLGRKFFLRHSIRYAISVQGLKRCVCKYTMSVQQSNTRLPRSSFTSTASWIPRRCFYMIWNLVWILSRVFPLSDLISWAIQGERKTWYMKGWKGTWSTCKECLWKYIAGLVHIDPPARLTDVLGFCQGKLRHTYAFEFSHY